MPCAPRTRPHPTRAQPLVRRHPASLKGILRRGGVVAYAVEACFGLGCDPRNATAVRRLLRLKRRPASKGLIVLAGASRDLRPYIQSLPSCAQKTWPGPHTWVIPAKPKVLACVRGHHHAVAVRVTAHKEAATLARVGGGAIISTSANRAGQRPARTHRDVCRRFGHALDAVLLGRIGGATRPTPIRDSRTGLFVRL